MLHYPHFNPVAFRLGSLSVHWYGIMYLLGFAAAWCLANVRAKRRNPPWSKEQVSDLIFYAALGVILGGRIGYTFFYNWSEFWASPLLIFKVWDGGMSFHGGMLGVGIATWVYARVNKYHWCDVIDFAVPLVPIGLGLGRLGNFINGEVWGRVSDAPWAMIFPHAGPLSRHPSQLYEFFFEGVVLFAIIWIYSAKPRPRFAVCALFLLCYGVFRFVLEFFRQPDAQLGFIAWDWLTMGQLLSFPLIVIGCVGLYWSYSRFTRCQKD